MAVVKIADASNISAIKVDTPFNCASPAPTLASTASTILRFATAFGLSPRMRFDLTINEFAKKVYFNEKFEIYHADTWRPYLNLDDLSLIVGKIIKSKKLNNNKYVFNTGYSEENYTKRQIIYSIAKILPRNKNYKFVEKDHFDKKN